MTAAACIDDEIPLRDYQTSAIDACRREMAQNRRRVCLVLPTGAGKTRTAASVVQSALRKRTPVLWLAHRSELVEQACQTLEGFGIQVGVVAASSGRRPMPDVPCQVASIQTLVAREAHRPRAGLIVWDECHHASEAAECWSSLLDSYPNVPLLGLTATPERGDGAGLAPLFNGLVVGATVRELTMAGHLVPCAVVRPDRMLQPGEIGEDPVDAYLRHGERRQAILFARSVEEALGYAAALNAREVRAECVTAVTPRADREAALELYRRGTVRVLTNVYVLTEGTDLPAASVCMLARGAGSAGIYLQMVGRVLRPAPGKTEALLWDGRGVSHLHGYPEDERLYSLDGRGIRLVAAPACKVCSAPLPSGYPCEKCGYQPTQAEAAETTIVGCSMERVDPAVRFSAFRQQNDGERWQKLLFWIRKAEELGHKPTSVRFKWRHVYGEDLPAAQLARAVMEVRRGG